MGLVGLGQLGAPVRSPRCLFAGSLRLSRRSRNLVKPVTSTLLKPYRKALDKTPVMPIIMADFRRKERGGR